MTNATKGVLAMAAACCVWGLSPLYYAQFEGLAALEILGHRSVWSLIIFGALVVLQGRARATLAAFKQGRTMIILVVAAIMIGINWYVFVFAITQERVSESSLGYYFFPLVAVLFGMIFFGERLTRLQWCAVGIASIAVGVLTVSYGNLPWLALLLAVTFAAYGLFKRYITLNPIVSVTVEVILMAPFGAAILWYFGQWHDPLKMLMLAFTGVLTAGPLVLMSYATSQIRMATLGLVQYLNPTLQFICAAWILAETLTPLYYYALPLIWVAVGLYTFSTFKDERKAAVKDGMSSKT